MLSVTEVARNFRRVLDSVEHGQEEIVLVRNRRRVARLVPEAPAENALEVFGSLAAALKRSGRDAAHRINDLWLAAQAIQRDCALLTSNPKDFKDIPRLKVVALRLA